MCHTRPTSARSNASREPFDDEGRVNKPGKDITDQPASAARPPYR